MPIDILFKKDKYILAENNQRANKFNKVNTGNWLELEYEVMMVEDTDIDSYNDTDQVFLMVEDMPKFPGGYDSLANFSFRTLNTPRQP